MKRNSFLPVFVPSSIALPTAQKPQIPTKEQRKNFTTQRLLLPLLALLCTVAVHTAKAQAPVVQDDWLRFKDGVKVRGVIKANSGDCFVTLEGTPSGNSYISRRRPDGAVDTSLFSFFSISLSNPIYDAAADAFYFTHRTGTGSGYFAVFDSVFVAKVSNASTTPTLDLRWTYLNRDGSRTLKKDGFGNLYQISGDKIYKITTAGVASLWCQPYYGEFRAIVDLSFDANGNGYCFNAGQYKYLTKITPAGVADTLWSQIHDVDFTVASQNMQPGHVEVAGNYVYTAHSLAVSGSINQSGINRYYLHKTPLSGAVNATYNLVDSFDRYFNGYNNYEGMITDIKADASGKLYISFYNSDTVVTYSPSGVISNPAFILPRHTMSERIAGEDFPLLIDQNGSIYISAHRDTVQTVVINMPPMGPMTYQFPVARRLLLKMTGSNTLPLQWLRMAASLNSSRQAQLAWEVQETDIKTYTVERSADGKSFVAIGELTSKGNGTNAYRFTEATPLKGTSYYRVKQTGRDGKTSYSETLRLRVNGSALVSAYPNPFHATITIQSNATQKAQLMDASGRAVQTFILKPGTTSLNTSGWSKGIYTLQTASGESFKLIRE